MEDPIGGHPTRAEQLDILASISLRAVNSSGCSPDAVGMMPGQGIGWADGCARRGSGGKEAGAAR